MAWTTPTVRSTGDLITASIWNTDLVADLAYLKGQAGVVEMEAGIKSDTDKTDDLGASDKRWNNVYGVNVFANRFRASPNIREVRINWEDDNRDEYQVTYAETGGGSVQVGGTGQIVLHANNNVVETARVYQTVEANNAKDNSWVNNPYMRIEFCLDNNDAQITAFLGLRAIPAAALPVGGEHFAGIKWTGSEWRVVSGDGANEEYYAVTATANQRHVIELYVIEGTSVEFWLDGAYQNTLSTYPPNAAMEWEFLIIGSVGGDATDRYLTVGQVILQEALS